MHRGAKNLSLSVKQQRQDAAEARLVRRFRDNALFCGFNPAVSASAMKAMREAIRDLNLRRQTQLSLQDIARQTQSALKGLDRVLRALCSLGAVSSAAIRQSHARGMGNA